MIIIKEIYICPWKPDKHTKLIPLDEAHVPWRMGVSNQEILSRTSTRKARPSDTAIFDKI